MMQLEKKPSFDNMWAADIETTGLLEDLVTQANPKIHNLGLKSVTTGKEVLYTHVANVRAYNPNIEMHDISELQSFLDTSPILIMHNGMLYDGEALRFFGYNMNNVIILDTLYLAWYLEPLRMRYGLAEYGEEFGIPKPLVDDWRNLPQDEYDRRVMQDCRIQLELWNRLSTMLYRLYDNVERDAWKALNYVCFIKSIPLRAAQRNGWDLDIDKCKQFIANTSKEKDIACEALAAVMPRTPIYKDKTKAANPFKNNGHLSSNGFKWYLFCALYGVDFDSTQTYSYLAGDKIGNPNAPQQVKNWLFSLGWEPETFEYKRDKETGEERQIPQVNIKNSGGKLDPDIERLMETHEELSYLEGYGIIKHRLGVAEGWLNSEWGGKLKARAAGFTNTLRLRHAEIVNVPSVRVHLGKELRELLIAPEGCVLLGSDLSSLEDRCKHHYQLPIDPEYVKSQLSPDFDPHLEICRLGGFLTVQQINDHKSKVTNYDIERALGKKTNYSCQYGAGAPSIARGAGVPLSVGQRLFDAYWELNWSIKEIAESTEVKSCNGCNWQFNPVSKIWYHLKTKKDRFSTLCQGTGSYAFDIWVWEIFCLCEERWNKEPRFLGQFHDEIIMAGKNGTEDLLRDLTKEAIVRANGKLRMRRDIDCGIDFGPNYACIH